MSDAALDKMIDEARLSGRRELEQSPRAADATYLPDSNVLYLELVDGTELRIAISNLQGLENASAAELANFELMPDGLAIHWDELDAHFTIPGLVRGLYGTKAWMQAIGKKGGEATTEGKRRASQENGRQGGRPGPSSPAEVPPRKGKFLVKEESQDRYVAKLYSANGRELLSTLPVETRDEAIGLARRMKGCVQRGRLKINLKRVPEGDVLTFGNANQHVMAMSGTYSNKSAASRAKRNILGTILGAPLEDSESRKVPAKRRKKKVPS